MEPNIEVGILSAPEIKFSLKGSYRIANTDTFLHGAITATLEARKVVIKTGHQNYELSLPVVLEPLDYQTANVTIDEVVIGIDFHWERKQKLTFKGALKFILENNRLTAINRLPIEDYLMSVISSEMSATASPAFLKAHAVISRSWFLAQKEKEKKVKGKANTVIGNHGERIKWYDREDHLNFDVCADDHCQRYQGITRAHTKTVAEAVADTSGEVLVYEGEICDARYAKACGGVTERFENVWEPVVHPYLTSIIDSDSYPEGFFTDISGEKEARDWIMGNPPAFCNTGDEQILSQVLNDYDRETPDFYRWRAALTSKAVKTLLKKKINIDVGDVEELIPLERGASGRIVKLQIKGTQETVTIGKELEIRKGLSESHLYSSAFVVDKETEGGMPVFVLHGAGWGHGVGLCQIGAAVMGDKGYTYQQILQHYFRGAKLEKRY